MPESCISTLPITPVHTSTKSTLIISSWILPGLVVSVVSVDLCLQLNTPSLTSPGRRMAARLVSLSSRLAPRAVSAGRCGARGLEGPPWSESLENGDPLLESKGVPAKRYRVQSDGIILPCTTS